MISNFMGFYLHKLRILFYLQANKYYLAQTFFVACVSDICRTSCGQDFLFIIIFRSSRYLLFSSMSRSRHSDK